MAGRRQGNVYNVIAESIQFFTPDVRKINTKESCIQELGGHGPGEVGEAKALGVQADSSTGASHAMKIARNYSADGLNQTPPSVAPSGPSEAEAFSDQADSSTGASHANYSADESSQRRPSVVPSEPGDGLIGTIHPDTAVPYGPDQPENANTSPTTKSSKRKPEEIAGADHDEPSTSNLGSIDRYLLTKRARIKELERELNQCIEEFNIEKRSQIMKEIRELCHSDDLEVILDLAEAELLSNKNDSSIGKVRDWISSSGSRSASDVTKMANELHYKENYVQSVILFKISHDLHKKEKRLSPDDELKWISARVFDIRCAINPLIEKGGSSRDIAKDYGLKFMEEMLKEVREVKNANPDVRVLNELRCLVEITFINSDLDDYERIIEFCEEGVKMMKQQFGENASTYKRYAWLLHYLGDAYHHSGQYRKAEHCYVTGIEADGKASDYENEEKRQESIDEMKQDLEKNRKNIS